MDTKEKLQQDKAYQVLKKPVLHRLSARKASVIGEAGGVPWEGNLLLVPTLGEVVRVNPADGGMEPELEGWHSLVVLDYLDKADGTPVTGRLMGFTDMKNGTSSGTKFGWSADKWFPRVLKGKAPEEIRRAFAAIGGEEIPGRGDISVRIPILPRFPLYVNVWEADEDLEASGKFFVDESADHYLTVEDAVTAAEIVKARLEELLGDH